MSFTQFSNPVNRPDVFKPLPDELILAGAKANYDRGEKQAQKIGGFYNNLFAITTYGKDAEVLSEFQQDFQNQVGELSKQNISSPEAQSKINQLINSYSTNPDVMAIHQRVAAYEKENQAKKEAESKGQLYRSPLLKEAEEYYSGDKYYTNKRFTRNGWVSPDTTKAMDEAVKAVTKQQYDPKTGFVTKTAKPEEVAANFYERIKNNPNYQKDLEYGFEQETEGVNWQDNGQQFVQGKVSKLTQQYNEALADGNQEAASLAQHELNRLQNLADPSLIGEELKKQAFQNYINTQLEKVGYANDVLDFQKIERDPIDMKLLEHKLNMQEDIYKLQLKTGLLPDKGESQSAYIGRLAKAAQDKDLEIAQAKSDITLQRQKELEQQRQDGKMSTLEYKTKNGVIQIKDNGEKQITLGGEEVDKATIKGDVERGNIKTIEKVLNEYGSSFGLSGTTVDPSGMFGDAVKIEEENGVKYAVYQNDNYAGDDDFKVPVSDIVKYIADPSHIPTVIKNGKPLTGSVDLIDKSNVEDQPSGEIQYSKDVDGKEIYSEDQGKTWKYKQ